jgi:hypothetical protein
MDATGDDHLRRVFRGLAKDADVGGFDLGQRVEEQGPDVDSIAKSLEGCVPLLYAAGEIRIPGVR